MTPVPFELPLRPPEANELANLVFELAEQQPLTDDLRARFATRAARLKLETIRPCYGSLERDPVHRGRFYLAVDGQAGQPLLLHIALASSPSSSLFPRSLLIGRMRRRNGTEMVINASPFASTDRENVLRFATEVNAAFLPRPQAGQSAVTAGGPHPETSLPAAFDAYRTILKRTGRNVACVSIPQHYHAGLWAAIRAGWREGYNAETGPIVVAGGTPDAVARSLEAAQETIRQAAAFTRFATDTTGLVRDEAGAKEKFESLFDDEVRPWILDEFAGAKVVGESSYLFSPAEVMRLAVKFGPSLKVTEQLFDSIRKARATQKGSRSFDFEVSFEQARTVTTPQELIFCLHWLRARGRAAQLAAVHLGGRLGELAAIARHYQVTLSVHARGGEQPEVLDAIARATAGRVSYRAASAGQINWVAEHLIG